MIIDLATLIVQETAATILAKALVIAEAVGLPVTSWAPGDPSRVYLKTEAEQFAEALEPMAAEYIKAGFLDTAEGDDLAWLKLHVDQSFGVTPIEATFATCTLLLTNTGGGEFTAAAGDLTIKNTVTGKTYHNTNSSPLTLAAGPGNTLLLDIVADEAGSDSNAIIGEIDDLVTDWLGVTCSNTTAAIGLDAESAGAMRDRARAKLGSLSPDGPADAYRYVATTPELAGTSAITRVRTQPNNGTGEVLIWLAGPSGAVLEADRALVEDAIFRWATPLCVTPTVASAEAVIFPITYTLWLYNSVSKSSSEIEDAVEAELQALFAVRPIGGDVITGNPGRLYVSHIAAAIRNAFPDHAFRVSVAAPASDTDLGIYQVPVLGTITATINLVANPS